MCVPLGMGPRRRHTTFATRTTHPGLGQIPQPGHRQYPAHRFKFLQNMLVTYACRSSTRQIRARCMVKVTPTTRRFLKVLGKSILGNVPVTTYTFTTRLRRHTGSKCNILTVATRKILPLYACQKSQIYCQTVFTLITRDEVMDIEKFSLLLPSHAPAPPPRHRHYSVSDRLTGARRRLRGGWCHGFRIEC